MGNACLRGQSSTCSDDKQKALILPAEEVLEERLSDISLSGGGDADEGNFFSSEGDAATEISQELRKELLSSQGEYPDEAMDNVCRRCSSSTSANEKRTGFNLPGKEVLNGLDELMTYIMNRLANAIAIDKAEEGTSGAHVTTSDPVTFSIKYASDLLGDILNRCSKHDSKIMSDGTRKVVIDGLKEASQFHLVAAWLSLVAYVLQDVESVSTNRKESVQLLKNMYGLANHIKQSNGYIGQEKLNDAADFIVKGSFFCISRIKSSSLSRFFSSEVDLEEINSLQSEMGDKYPSLKLEPVTEILEERPTKLAWSQSENPNPDDNQNASDLPEDMLSRLDDLMTYIEKWLAKPPARHKAEENTSVVDGTASGRVASFIKKGKKLLRNVLEGCEKHGSKIMSGETRKVVIDVVKEVSSIHWLVAGLSVVSYVLQKVDDVSTNKEDCVQFLRYMYGLAKHVKQLNGQIPKEKLHDIAEFIFKGSFFCVSRIQSSKLSRFFSCVVDVEEIKNLQSELEHNYRDLTLEAITQLLHREPLWLPASPWGRPDAVGINEASLEVKNLLCMEDGVSIRAVVVHGIGGMGKTTLAAYVYSSLDLKSYIICSLIIDQNCSKTDLKNLQEQILYDLFGKRVALRDYREGQREICESFKRNQSQPLFLFIDNALRRSDLAELLPEDLSSIPKGSRILVTTRYLNETEMLDQGDIITRLSYPINPLQPAEAKKLLSKKVFGKPDATFDSSLDIDGLVTACGGIPLVLNLVGSRLHRDRNDLSTLNNTMAFFKDSLGSGESDITDQVVDVVCNNLPGDRYREAFLDIAAFFSNWERHLVSYIVGEEELAKLEDAALVKISNRRVELHDVVLKRAGKLSQLDRITDLQTLIDILEDPQRPEQVKGICLQEIVQVESAFQLKAEHLDKMRNLRVLCLRSRIPVTGACTKKFQNLRYLEVDYRDCSPMKLNQLPRLAIFWGRIRSDERFCNLPHCLCSLKARGLENLVLDESLSNLNQLEELELMDYMTELPQSFGQLKSLRRLSLCRFRELTSLPESFDQLKKLKELTISDCPNLCSLSDKFGQLMSLQYLRIRRCPNLQRLSDDFGSLPLVSAIGASGCPLLEGNAVDQMIGLKSLIILDIKESPMLIKRWEEIKEGHPLRVCTEEFKDSLYRQDMYKHSMSRTLFDGESRFVKAENGSVADWSSTFLPNEESQFVPVDDRPSRVKHVNNFAFLLTCTDLCSPANEEACKMVKKKIEELFSKGFQIMYVGLMEQSETRIRETLLHLSQGISGGASLHAWIAPRHKWKQIFGFSGYEMVWHWYASKRELHTFIAYAYIKILQGKPQVESLELNFPEVEDEEDEDHGEAKTEFGGDFATQYSDEINNDRFLESKYFDDE